MHRARVFVRSGEPHAIGVHPSAGLLIEFELLAQKVIISQFVKSLIGRRGNEEGKKRAADIDCRSSQRVQFALNLLKFEAGMRMERRINLARIYQST